MERARLIDVVRATGGAVEHGGFFFLVDPHWNAEERAAAEGIFAQAKRGRFTAPPGGADEGFVAVRTGGSSGGMKFARHDERTFGAAVSGFCAHFGLERVDAVDVLPPWHISGLMTRVRCAATGGHHLAWPWKRLEALDLPPAAEPGQRRVLSLVPTQLQRLLAAPAAVAWLREFAVIFLGGGPTWPELADAAAAAGLRISLSYGMTETAAMVTALRPEEFLAGARSCGASLPHATLNVNAEGVLTIRGKSVCHGYLTADGGAGFAANGPIPVRSDGAREFVTDDLGRIDAHGHVHLQGRRDQRIITGGKKVEPAEVEAALRASGEFIDVAVVGVPDAEWGQVVVACYVAGSHAPDPDRASARLAPHQRPKKFVPLADWPRNAQGKVNRAELLRLIAAKR